MNLKSLNADLQNLTARVAALEEQLVEAQRVIQTQSTIIAQSTKGAVRGPKSEGSMTDYIAWRIRFGDRKEFSVNENAEFFKLSRGQIYSINKYTFQNVKPDSFTLESSDE